jgi:thiamine-monophosphate kinase
VESQNTGRTEIAEFGEFRLIDHLTNTFRISNRSSVYGVGDDAGVIDHDGWCTLVSTDLLLEGVHFDLMYCPLKHLGYKSIVVNLSDIYAMNATPTQVTVSIGISNRFSVEALEELYAGMQAACEAHGVDLIGGDTTTSLKGFVISVTAIGTSKKDKIVYRKGAKVGDKIAVSGDLGAAFMGLQLLEREKSVYLENNQIQPDLEGQEYVVGRQLKPEARKDIIEILDRLQIVPTAMIDVSDGLSSEIMHICKQSGVGCLLKEADIPIDQETYHLALKFNLDPITCAMNGGEDYELLFTLSPEDAANITEESGIKIIGEIVCAADGCKLESKSGKIHQLKAQGWNPLEV